MLDNFNEEDLINNQEKEVAMKNTGEFWEALNRGALKEAEDFLTEVVSSPDQFPQYDNDWLDDRQRDLFRSFYKEEDWQGAKRMVEAAKITGKVRSYEGRKARLEDLSGMKYEEI